MEHDWKLFTDALLPPHQAALPLLMGEGAPRRRATDGAGGKKKRIPGMSCNGSE